jgi:paxillin
LVVTCRCEQPLLNDDGMHALDLVFHVDCFQCFHCERPFRDAPYYVRGGRPYCKGDYLALFGSSVCAGCMESFKKGDTAMEAVGKVCD